MLFHLHGFLRCRPVTTIDAINAHTTNASLMSDDSALSTADNDSSLSNKAASLSLSRGPAKSKTLQLCTNARPKVGDYELKILEQPEQQHRARYLTEGSRGAIKDKSQDGHPVVKVFMFMFVDNTTVVQIFITGLSFQSFDRGVARTLQMSVFCNAILLVNLEVLHVI